MSQMFSLTLGVKMRVLVVLLLAVLGCSVADNPLKCELMNQLLDKTKEKKITVDNLVAKIVCHVEYGSGFNTSAVNELKVRRDGEHGRGKRSGYGGMLSLAELDDASVTIQPHTREKRHAMRPPKPTPKQEEAEVWTLYGLFQLSNRLVCTDGTTPSPNICEMDCSNLTDDYTDDDIDCVFKLFHILVDEGFSSSHWKDLRRMIMLIYQEECRGVNTAEYFSECRQ